MNVDRRPRHWTFQSLDTCFFRESRPHNLAGAVELGSLFPPPARTVAGAVRTLLGEGVGVDWRAYNRNDGTAHRLAGVNLVEEMGTADTFGRLRLRGPYLCHDGRRLYPAPACLSRIGERFSRLAPGREPVRCDLGPVYLPDAVAPSGAGPGERPRSLADAWLTAPGLARFLAGGVPEPGEVVESGDLWSPEVRVGIGRQVARRTVAESLLYQTRHIRPGPGLSVEVEVGGIDSRLHPRSGLLRFGGEGRPARIETRPSDSQAAGPGESSPPGPPPGARGLLLLLLTHGDLDGDWKPPGFRKDGDEKGATVWRGEIGGVGLTLLSAVQGRAVREGGWSLADGKPRPVVSLIPAGTVWFCEVEGNVEEAVRALQGARIGRDTEIGRGELAAGYWL